MSGSNLYTGTLDLLILRALRSGPDHGYGIGAWIREVSGDALSVEEGVLYPALHRLEGRGWLQSHWGKSESNRRAKFYGLTAAGEKACASETERWNQHTDAVARVLGTSSR
ncbi:MAG: PadR family transcriptional regulator [Longimicrobiales bacterium]